MSEEKDFNLECLITKVLTALRVPQNLKNGDLYFLSRDFYVRALFHDSEFSIEAYPEQGKIIKSFPYESGLENFVEKENADKKCLGFVPIHESAEALFRKINLKPLESETEYSEETMYKIWK